MSAIWHTCELYQSCISAQGLLTACATLFPGANGCCSCSAGVGQPTMKGALLLAIMTVHGRITTSGSRCLHLCPSQTALSANIVYWEGTAMNPCVRQPGISKLHPACLETTLIAWSLTASMLWRPAYGYVGQFAACRDKLISSQTHVRVWAHFWEPYGSPTGPRLPCMHMCPCGVPCMHAHVPLCAVCTAQRQSGGESGVPL